MGVLCSDVHHQGTFESKQIGRKDGGLVHEESIKFVFLEKKFNKFLPVLFAGEGRFNVEHWVLRGIHQHLFAEGESSHGLKPFPVVDETIFQDAFGVAVFAGKGVEEVEFYLFSVVAVDLDVLSVEVSTEGDTRSGRSLPANPILVLREPTSMMRGIPYM